MALSKKQPKKATVQPAGIEQVQDDFYLLKDAGAMVQFTGGNAIDKLYGPASVGVTSGLKIALWGPDNLQPQRMMELVYANHLKPQLIYTARDFVIGSRLSVFKRTLVEDRIKIVPVIDPQIEDWMEQVEAQKYLRAAAYNLEFFHNAFTDFQLDTSKKVAAMEVIDCTDGRAEQMVKGRIENYFYHPDWRNFKQSECKTIPAYDKLNPAKFPEFIYHGRDALPGNPYYDCPPWWGGEQWTKVSNQIPKFHISGLKNGYNIKYHIRIPKDYFLQFGNAEAQKKAEKNLMENMNAMLSGVDNADKAFVSKFGTDPVTQKPLAGWEILPIENKMSDDAYSKVNDQANMAHTSGHGIDPSLAGIDTGSKLGGSGSEKRISYQLHIALRTPNKRQILLEPFKVAARINGFNADHFIGIEDIDITTLEENPTGKQKVVNQAQ